MTAIHFKYFRTKYKLFRYKCVAICLYFFLSETSLIDIEDKWRQVETSRFLNWPNYFVEAYAFYVSRVLSPVRFDFIFNLTYVLCMYSHT